MKVFIAVILIGFLLITAICLTGCTTQETKTKTTAEKVELTDRENEIAKTYYERLCAVPPGDTPNPNLSREETLEENEKWMAETKEIDDEIRKEVADQYGITTEELSDIYSRAIDYNLEHYGTVTGNW